jgi:hypothetical protein
VDDDGRGVLADLGGVQGAVAALEQATGNGQQATEREAAEHVPIIRCSYRGRFASDSFRRYSRAQ